MIKINSLSLDLHLGSFHGVSAATMAPNGSLSIITRGAENILPLRGQYNLETGQWMQIEFESDFSSDDAELLSGGRITYLDITEVTKVSIGNPQDYGTFETRELRIETSEGVNLIWELYTDLPMEMAA